MSDHSLVVTCSLPHLVALALASTARGFWPMAYVIFRNYTGSADYKDGVYATTFGVSSPLVVKFLPIIFLVYCCFELSGFIWIIGLSGCIQL